MRYVNVLALVIVLALVVVAISTVPSCISHFVETPTDWKQQREHTRKEARDSIERLEKQYGDTPFEQWEERHRQIYRNAKRILGEMGD